MSASVLACDDGLDVRKIGKASDPVKAFVRARCAERAGSEEKAAEKKRGAGDKRRRGVAGRCGCLLRECKRSWALRLLASPPSRVDEMLF
jgi:hypothetical protein